MPLRCFACNQFTDTFVSGGITLPGGQKVRSIFCSACVVQMKTSLDKKYKQPPVVIETDGWEAWSTPTDES